MFAIEKVESILGHKFRNKALAKQALTHASADSRNYERFEYTGDGFLSHFVGKRLTEADPGAGPGVLTRRRSAITCNNFLAGVSRRSGLSDCLISSERNPSSKVYADIVEAAIGAVLEDSGEDAASRVVERLLGRSLPQPRSRSMKPQVAAEGAHTRVAKSPRRSQTLSERSGPLSRSKRDYEALISRMLKSR